MHAVQGFVHVSNGFFIAFVEHKCHGFHIIAAQGNFQARIAFGFQEVQNRQFVIQSQINAFLFQQLNRLGQAFNACDVCAVFFRHFAVVTGQRLGGFLAFDVFKFGDRSIVSTGNHHWTRISVRL